MPMQVVLLCPQFLKSGLAFLGEMKVVGAIHFDFSLGMSHSLLIKGAIALGGNSHRAPAIDLLVVLSACCRCCCRTVVIFVVLVPADEMIDRLPAGRSHLVDAPAGPD